MVKGIEFKKYKKFNNQSFVFSPDINVISGENGTCKSSLLYLIGNSFQSVSSNAPWIKDKRGIRAINTINANVNPKVERMQRGDKKYNDPAIGVHGPLYKVSYFDHEDLEFRRHNSDINMRYALKPQYPRGAKQNLPSCPVIYLGLTRLLPFGEYQKDDEIRAIKTAVPEEVKQRISEDFRNFTHYDIVHNVFQSMGDLKKRSDFTSNKEGIDSNTISAGEDNLYIIFAALESLRFYYETIESTRKVESVLLIDELDATLHPNYQIRLMAMLREYSEKYKIQIYFTTHSLAIVEDAIQNNDNLLYLVDNLSDIAVMDDPTLPSIKAHLYGKSKNDIYHDKHIPVLTEDGEARWMLKMLLNYLEETKPEFINVRRFFTIPEINIGADILRSLFKDAKLIRSYVGICCILDGDQKPELSNCIITLPGQNSGGAGNNLSPEALLIEYAQLLIDRNSHFWTDQAVLAANFGKKWYIENVATAIEEYNNGDMKEKRREFNKRLFNVHIDFYEYLFKFWMHDPYNENSIEKFYQDLKIVFKKCAPLREISPKEWKE